MRQGARLCVALIAAVATMGGTAQADVTEGTAGAYTYLRDTSAMIAATGVGGALVECPAGTKALGGGATVGGAAANTHINSAYPVDIDADGRQDDAWQAYFHNVAGDPKQVTVHVVCADLQARYVKTQVKVSPGDARAVKAVCPRSRHVSGGGIYISAESALARVNSSYPIDTNSDRDKRPDDGWRVRGYNIAGGEKDIASYAICVKARPKYVVDDPVQIDQGGEADASALCPAVKHVTGGGVRMQGATPRTVHPVTMGTSDGNDGDAASDDLFDVAGGAEILAPSPARMTAIAVCMA